MVILKGTEMLQVGREKGSTPKESKIRGIPLYRRKGTPTESQVHGPEASKAALVIWQLDPPMRRQGWEERCWYTIRQGEHVWDRGDSLESLGDRKSVV